MPSCQDRKQSPIKANIYLKKKKKLSGFQDPAVTETQIYVKKSIHHNGRSLCFFMIILDPEYQANIMFLLG